MKYFTVVFFIIPFVLVAQNNCDVEVCEKKVKNKNIWTNATYTGCVNFFDQPHGQGKQTFDDGQIVYGCWKDGKKNGDITIEYVDGFKKYCIFKNDIEDKCRTIIEHYYDPNDIITSMESFDIDLLHNNSHDFIKLTIDNNSDVFLYDTGASKNTMKREFFNSIPKELYKKLYTTKGKKSTIRVTQADGTLVKSDYYLFKKIVIQNIEIQNVIFSVSKKGGSNLIGQDFWNKFSKYIPPKDGKIKVFK